MQRMGGSNPSTSLLRPRSADVASSQLIAPIGEHSRALLKPSFDKAYSIDLFTLERYWRMLIDYIPRDGSTVDLQPLLFSLVSCQSCSGLYHFQTDTQQYLDTTTLFLFGSRSSHWREAPLTKLTLFWKRSILLVRVRFSHRSRPIQALVQRLQMD